jgi:hypothetical protein
MLGSCLLVEAHETPDKLYHIERLIPVSTQLCSWKYRTLAHSSQPTCRQEVHIPANVKGDFGKRSNKRASKQVLANQGGCAAILTKAKLGSHSPARLRKPDTLAGFVLQYTRDSDLPSLKACFETRNVNTQIR